MDKIKVVLICHFSNSEVREQLPLSKNLVQNIIRSLLNKPRSGSYSDFAPWVTNLIHEFELLKNVELHVIAPHSGLKKSKFEFEKQGVFYHFFQCDSPILHLNTQAKKKHPTFSKNRIFISQFINHIKPDIVNLIGAENPYYAISVLDINDIPVYLSCQTVYSNPLRKVHSDSMNQFIWDLELKIHKKVEYFGCSGRMHRDLVQKNNSEAKVFKMFFPIEKPKAVANVKKQFDFVFFAAGVTEKKGVEDAIKACAIVKDTNPKVTLKIVGKCASSYKQKLDALIIELGVSDNISFKDYFTEHSDMHKYISKGKFALLPVKLDIIPGAVIEAILLNIPVVTYKTTGTPYLNKNGKAILISEIGDIDALAANMNQLLIDPSFGDTLKTNARALVEKEFDNTISAKRLISNYKAVISHYQSGTPIPQDQLFDINEFPIY